jgi:hypothetical protein
MSLDLISVIWIFVVITKTDKLQHYVSWDVYTALYNSGVGEEEGAFYKIFYK